DILFSMTPTRTPLSERTRLASGANQELSITGKTSTHSTSRTAVVSQGSVFSCGETRRQLAVGTRRGQTARTSELMSVQIISQPAVARRRDHRPPSQPTSSAGPGGPARSPAVRIASSTTSVVYLPQRVVATDSQTVGCSRTSAYVTVPPAQVGAEDIK